jgi:uncharacterized protein CbrC (UPF0167 family)
MRDALRAHRANQGLKCGFCFGWKPGESQPPIATDRASSCPCCGQYASTLYEGPCTAHHEGYGSQKHLARRA